MYNKNRKSQFMDNYPENSGTRDVLDRIFNIFEPYELEWGMDLAQQEVDELQRVVDSMPGVRNQSIEAVLGLLREYVKFCKEEGYETTDAIYDVKINTTNKILRKMVSSPSHLKVLLDEFFDYPSEETADITNRVYMWLAFSGLKDVDTAQISIVHVDFNKMSINFENKHYEIYEEEVEDLRKACELTSFVYVHNEPYYTTRMSRAVGTLILRGTRTPIVNLSTLRNIVNRKVIAKSPERKGRLSYSRIRLSGIYYREYLKEKQGLETDFSAIAAEEVLRHQQEKGYSLTPTRTIKTIVSQYKKNYELDYKKWKKAFNIEV